MPGSPGANTGNGQEQFVVYFCKRVAVSLDGLGLCVF